MFTDWEKNVHQTRVGYIMVLVGLVICPSDNCLLFVVCIDCNMFVSFPLLVNMKHLFECELVMPNWLVLISFSNLELFFLGSHLWLSLHANELCMNWDAAAYSAMYLFWEMCPLRCFFGVVPNVLELDIHKTTNFVLLKAPLKV